MSGNAPDAMLSWARVFRRGLIQALGPANAGDLVLNLYGATDACGWGASELARKLAPEYGLPGMHRLDALEFGLVLTLMVRRTGSDPGELAAQLCVQADAILTESLGCEQEPDEPFAGLSPGQLSTLLRADGVVIERASGRIVPGLAVTKMKPMRSPCIWLRDDCAVSPGASVAVVGAGIAGLTVAHALSHRGFAVTVLDEHDPLGPQGVHHGHLAAALTPVISADDNVRSRLSRAGALMADRLWRELPESVGRRCGALQLQKPRGARRQVDLAKVAAGFDLPQWARSVDVREASDLAGCQLDRGGLWMPGGWLIRVPSLLQTLVQQASVTVQVAKVCRVERRAGQWVVFGAHGEALAHAGAVVLATAGDAPSLLARSPVDLSGQADDAGIRRMQVMHRLAGEVTWIPEQVIASGPRCILGGDGYVLPAVDGWCVAGGTYVRDASQAQVTDQGRAENLQRVASLLNLPDLPGQVGDGVSSWPGWAGWRAVVPGRLPVVGPVGADPGLFVCTAGASRGLTWSSLQAHLIADLLQARAPALERVLLANIASGFL
ncbi:FAD-dependent 5-carboxymethylaminomethyl-2-thiouridine(34) oxidoreductase MnmC [Orrella marina]|uniref:FAD-dependent 5-carboxymethylaminomethyl-2-thiouridine(34) oxidoreductase MnmC n=1 Tax=Orrella marina TaxID=2163011 RepID=UPI00131EE2FF|nr:FAD-dependent 5-carboxymethylaminomethyl-2-thiouridine(34) oxidoreductase MnmC [Orrella marina]